MNRPLRVILLAAASLALVLVVSACGTERIGVPKSDPHYKSDEYAATLFAQKCAGCHTLSFAATHGSGANPRTYEAINGPSFNVRCERPAIRVLYAIENGGFSGAYMPQNIFVGPQARLVAMFVSRYAGENAPQQPDVVPCGKQAVGTLPPLPTGATLSASSTGVTPSAGNPALPKSSSSVKSSKQAKKAYARSQAKTKLHKATKKKK